MSLRKLSSRAEEIVRETGTDAVVIISIRLNPSGGLDVEHGSYLTSNVTENDPSEGLAHVLEVVAEHLRTESDAVDAAEPS